MFFKSCYVNVFAATIFAFITRSEKTHYYCSFEKQPPRGVLRKGCSEQQIYRRTPMPKCDSIKLLFNFIEIALWRGCSPANLLYIFRTPFSKNNSGWLLLSFAQKTNLWDTKYFSSINNTNVNVNFVPW